MRQAGKRQSSITRSQRSKSSQSTKKYHLVKCERQIFAANYEQKSLHKSIDEASLSPTPSPKKRRAHPQSNCKECDSMRRKIKEREDHFKQMISIYHQQSDKLKHINESLRQQLEQLYLKQQNIRKQFQQLKKDYDLLKGQKHRDVTIQTRRKQLQMKVSPIEKGRQPIIIQRISQKILSELESPTFSQLLAGTPQTSHINTFDSSQKQNALKAEFDRLMRQCQSTTNRSKKTTLRKQMASIANQISGIQKD